MNENTAWAQRTRLEEDIDLALRQTDDGDYEDALASLECAKGHIGLLRTIEGA